MKWEEYQKNQLMNDYRDWAETYIECPNCGEKIYKNTTIVLTSMPPKFHYKCFNCGWTNVGY